MTLNEIIEKLKMENARSRERYGLWKDLASLDHADAIHSEFEEWQDAYYGGDVDGEHGEIAEAIHVMNVMARRIMFLTGEWDA